MVLVNIFYGMTIISFVVTMIFLALTVVGLLFI